MAGSVIKAANKRADELLTTTGKTVLPTFTAQTEAQEEADQLNVIVEAVSTLVGSNITNAILQMANGSNHKSINDFTLYDVMKVVINGADQPSTKDMLEQLLEVINHTFDFCKKVSVNMELIKRSTHGHVWHCHWYPTAHAHTVGQHQDSHQI
jgi:hypothetical protein